MLSDSSINTLSNSNYFVDTSDSDVPWSFNSTRWMMDGVKIYNDLVYVDVEYDHDGVEYDHDGTRMDILNDCVEGCFAILQNQAMYIFGSTLGRHFYPDHEFAMEVDPAVTLGVTPANELGRYPCRLIQVLTMAATASVNSILSKHKKGNPRLRVASGHPRLRVDG